MKEIFIFYCIITWLIGIGQVCEIKHYNWFDYIVSSITIWLNPIILPISIGIQLQRKWE